MVESIAWSCKVGESGRIRRISGHIILFAFHQMLPFQRHGSSVGLTQLIKGGQEFSIFRSLLKRHDVIAGYGHEPPAATFEYTVVAFGSILVVVDGRLRAGAGEMMSEAVHGIYEFVFAAVVVVARGAAAGLVVFLVGKGLVMRAGASEAYPGSKLHMERRTRQRP